MGEAGENENTFCSNPETFPDRRRAHRLLLGLKSRFIFSPVHQPDCSSDPRMWPPLSGVDCWLELDGNCVLIHDCNIQGGESESLVSADLSERLTWIKTRTHTHPCYVCMCWFAGWWIHHQTTSTASENLSNMTDGRRCSQTGWCFIHVMFSLPPSSLSDSLLEV